MSVYSGPLCSGANQSPINLSQSFAKPCNLSCDLVMDDGDVTQANGATSELGLVLTSPTSLGSCKFRGESYVCQFLFISHPSHHTIEGVQADAEVTAIFKKPTGEMMQLSSLIRISSAQTPSLSFFKQFVPYVDPNANQGTAIALKDWSLSALVPPEASYYVYNGSSITAECGACERVVFKSMINMDQGDFAYLVKNVQASSRPVQALGDREVFFNDTNNVPGGPMPHDGKFYLRLKPTGNSHMGKPGKKHVDLEKHKGPAPVDDTTVSGQMQKAVKDYTEKYGGAGIILGAIAVIGVCAGAYYGYQYSKEKPITGESTVPLAIKTRDTAWWLAQKLWAFLTWFFTTAYEWTIGLFGKIAGLFGLKQAADLNSASASVTGTLAKVTAAAEAEAGRIGAEIEAET